MTGYLLDSSVISEIRRPRPSANVLAFVRAQAVSRFFVSVVTLAEIRYGIEMLTDAARRAEIGDWLDHAVRPIFAGRVLTVDEDVMSRWRLLVDAGRRIGRTCAQPDLLVAATAQHHGLTAVTRDATEFVFAGVRVLDPWEANPT